MFVQKVLIGKGGSINAQLARSVMIQEISTLNHKVIQYTMKDTILVPGGLFVL
jgi:hypothetical protein